MSFAAGGKAIREKVAQSTVPPQTPYTVYWLLKSEMRHYSDKAEDISMLLLTPATTATTSSSGSVVCYFEDRRLKEDSPNHRNASRPSIAHRLKSERLQNGSTISFIQTKMMLMMMTTVLKRELFAPW